MMEKYSLVWEVREEWRLDWKVRKRPPKLDSLNDNCRPKIGW